MKKISEKKRQSFIKKRDSILERIRDPKRMSLKRAKKAILRNFRYDPQIYQIFFFRSDLKKRLGIALCLELKDPNNWFLLFKNPNVKFSVPELLFWAIKADNYANIWGVMLNNPSSEERGKYFSDFSILNKVLERKDVKEFLDNASFFTLMVTASKLNFEEKVWKIIIKKIKKFNREEKKILFPVNVLYFLIRFATLVPITLFSVFLSLGIDIYLKNRYQKGTK